MAEAKDISKVHELLDLDIEEISAVDKAANRRQWLVIKRAEDLEKGSPSSGDYGHSGRQGTEGGSSPGPGGNDTNTDTFTLRTVDKWIWRARTWNLDAQLAILQAFKDDPTNKDLANKATQAVKDIISKERIVFHSDAVTADNVDVWLGKVDKFGTEADAKALQAFKDNPHDTKLSEAAQKAAYRMYMKEHAIEKAAWSAAFVNDLPDSSFAYVEPGGEKDDDGKTTPRSLRHLPYKDADGKPDAAHTRNALARLEQTDISDTAKAHAKTRLLAAAKGLGIQSQDAVEKNDDEEEPPMNLEQRMQAQALWAAWSPLWYSFSNVVYDIMDHDVDDTDDVPILLQSIEQFLAQAKAIFGGLGLLKKVEQPLDMLTDVTKVGRVMAGGRQKKLEQAMTLLQSLVDDAKGEGSMAKKDMPGLKALMDKSGMKVKDLMDMSSSDVLEKLGLTMKAMMGHMGEGMKSGMAKAGVTDMKAMMGMPMKGLMQKLGLNEKDFEPDDDDMPPAKDAKPPKVTKANIVGWIARAKQQGLTAAVEQLTTVQDEGTDSDWQAVQAIAKQVKTAEKSVPMDKNGDDVSEVTKSEMVALRKRVEDAELRAAAAEKIAKGELDQRLQVEYIQKTAQYRAAGVAPDDWHVLKAIDTLPEGPRDRVLHILKAAHEQLKVSSLFGQHGFGSEDPALTDASDAEAQILSLAKAYRDTNKTDLALAIDATAKEHPELWERYQVQKRQMTKLPLRS